MSSLIHCVDPDPLEKFDRVKVSYGNATGDMLARLGVDLHDPEALRPLLCSGNEGPSGSQLMLLEVATPGNSVVTNRRLLEELNAERRKPASLMQALDLLLEGHDFVDTARPLLVIESYSDDLDATMMILSRDSERLQLSLVTGDEIWGKYVILVVDDPVIQS